MLSENDISELLEAAFREHAQQGDSRQSLLPFVCGNFATILHLQIFGIWQRDVTRCELLWPTEHTLETRGLEPGVARISPGEAARAVMQLATEGTEQKILWAGSALTESLSIVIALRIDDPRLDDTTAVQIADLIADLRRWELLTALTQGSQQSSRLLQWIAKLPACESETELLHAFVTDGALLCGAGRLSVLKKDQLRSWSELFSTGADSFAPRSSELDRLKTSVVAAEKSRQITEELFPISLSGTWSDARYSCIAEKATAGKAFDPQVLKLLTQQLVMSLDQLERRQQAHRFSQRQLLKGLSSLGGALFLAAIVAGFAFWKTDFEIRVLGETYPVERQYLYSPEHGVISDVLVDHEERVRAGQVICRLTSDRLEVLREQTREELISSQARLAALQTISPRESSNLNPGGLPVTVEQSELAEKIASLETQMQLISEQISHLEIRAPFDGQIIHERLREELLGRPVQQGQQLFQIMNPESDWEIELRLPEREFRHISAVQQQSADGAEVSYLLETSPTVEHVTRLDRISNVTEIDETGGLSTRAWASIPDAEKSEQRFGAGVLARVHCGKRTWLSIMTRGVSEFWARYAPF